MKILYDLDLRILITLDETKRWGEDEINEFHLPPGKVTFRALLDGNKWLIMTWIWLKPNVCRKWMINPPFWIFATIHVYLSLKRMCALEGTWKWNNNLWTWNQSLQRPSQSFPYLTINLNMMCRWLMNSFVRFACLDDAWSCYFISFSDSSVSEVARTFFPAARSAYL